MEQIISLVVQYKYLALFPLTALQGPVFSLAVGFIVYMGYLNFFFSFFVMVATDILMDATYYYLGRFGNQKKFVRKLVSRSDLVSKHFDTISKLWHNHGRQTIFFSKLAWGLSGPFLITAGFVKMPFGKFIKYAIPVSLLEYTVLMTTGYILGQSYQAAVNYIRYGGVIIAVFLLAFVLFYRYFTKFARKQIKKLEELEEEHRS